MSEVLMSICAVLGILLVFLIGLIFGGMILIKGIKSVWKFLFK